MLRHTLNTVLGLFVVFTAASLTRADEAALPLILEEGFEKGADAWQPTDAAAWKLVAGEHGQAYSLFQQSKYKPPHRSPFNFSLAKDAIVSDFTLQVRVKSTAREYDHRSMCLIFGYQDPAHFYYVHLGKKADDHANQIFIVNDAPRIKISTKTTPGTAWDDKWHDVKILRRVADGSIAIYFDDMSAPVMTATDKNFLWGQIGLGSFDDVGDYDDVKLYGLKAVRP